MMRISFLLTAVLLFLTQTISFAVEEQVKMGMVTLKPYIAPGEELNVRMSSVLMDKMNQIVAQNGMGGSGFDNRFILTVHVVKLEENVTETIPPKTALRVAVNFFIGDGVEGTLFSTYSMEVKGIGDNLDDALFASLKKIKVRDTELQSAVEQGRTRIIEYYDNLSSSLIANARTAAANGKYDEAMATLMVVPSQCKCYEEIQGLITSYAYEVMENYNMDIIRNARAVWYSDQTGDGAAAASDILTQINRPSQKVIDETIALYDEMSSVLETRERQMFELQMQHERQNHEKEMQEQQIAHESRMQKEKIESELELQSQRLQHERNMQQEKFAAEERMSRQKAESEERIATINAAASVAKAYAENQPETEYVICWW